MDTFCRESKNPPLCLQGFWGSPGGETLGKTVNERKHLSGREFERLFEAVRGSRNEVRDRCLVLLMFRHGLRVSEACGLVLVQVDIESRILHVARLKGASPYLKTYQH